MDASAAKTFSLTRRWDAWKASHMGRIVMRGFKSQGHLYGVAIAAMVIMAASAGAIAWVMERIIDAMTASEGQAAVFAVAGVIVAIFTTRGIAGYLQSYFMARAGNRLVAELQDELYRKLLQRAVGFYKNTESSDLLMRFTNGAQGARGLVETLVSGFVRDLLTMVFLAGVMFYQQPRLSIICLVVGPLAVLGIRYLLRQVRAIMEQEMKSLAEIIKVMQETSAGIEVVKVFGLENRLINRMDTAIRSVEQRNNSVMRLQSITSPLMDTLAGFAIATVVIVSALGFGSGEPATPGQLMSFVTALLMTYEPGKRVSRMRVSIEAQMVMVRMVFDLLDEEDGLLEKLDAVSLPSGDGRVELQNVSFKYNENIPVINDMSLVFEAGKMTALVGQSGGGKSTIAALIMRFFDPDEGVVLINGHDIRDVTFDSLHGKISYVGQQTFLFSTTVMENMRCSRPDASDEDIFAAAKAAHAHDFIMALPKGYETLVGENGAFLSGGQKQRLSIARAILRRAEVLLLDEATSALDSESEALVKSALIEATRGKTTIVIAHRLSTIMEADRIAVIQSGQVVEQGTADDLLHREDGAFRRLFDTQFKNETVQ